MKFSKILWRCPQVYNEFKEYEGEKIQLQKKLKVMESMSKT